MSEMSNQHRIKIVQTVGNFASEIYKAGGDPSKFLDEMETMTVGELIDTMAINGIRFKCIKGDDILHATELKYPSSKGGFVVG